MFSKLWSIFNAVAVLAMPLYTPFIQAHPAIFGGLLAGANAVLHLVTPALGGKQNA